jgi:hypothetical protein
MFVPLSDAVSPSIDLWSHGSLDVAWDHCMWKKTRWFFKLKDAAIGFKRVLIPVTYLWQQSLIKLAQFWSKSSGTCKLWFMNPTAPTTWSEKTRTLWSELCSYTCYIAAQIKLFLHYSHKQIVWTVLCHLFFAFFLMDTIYILYTLSVMILEGEIQTHLHSIKTIPWYLLHCKFPQNNPKTVHIRSAEWP